MTLSKCLLRLAVLGSFSGDPAAAATGGCPASNATAAELEAYRAAAVAIAPGPDRLAESVSLTLDPIAADMKRCFPQRMPACMTRLYDYLTVHYLSDGHGDIAPEQPAPKQPPIVLWHAILSRKSYIRLTDSSTVC